MSELMSHRDWMKLTDGGMMSMRSNQLKAVDNALLAYERQRSPAARNAVNAALQGWIGSKGAGWKTSVRNKHNAVDSLFRQLTGLGNQGPADRVALSHIRDETRAIVTDLFQGKQLTFRPGILTKIAGNDFLSKAGVGVTVFGTGRSVHKLAALHGSGGGGGHAGQLASGLLDEVIPPAIRGEVLQALAAQMPSFMHELAASCAPFVGLGTSGAGVLIGAAKVARAEFRLEQARMHSARTLSAGEAEAALNAVVRMLDRESTNSLAGLAVGMTEFGGKAAAFLADGGTATNAAIGAASGLVKLIMIARLAVRDIGERNDANAILKQPVITVKLFEACPVMGAYLVCCAPTSVIMNTILDPERFGQPGMMDIVERAAKKHLAPMKAQAQRLVKEHRMFIAELQNHAGVLETNKKKLKAMLKNKGNGKYVGMGPDDF